MAELVAAFKTWLYGAPLITSIFPEITHETHDLCVTDPWQICFDPSRVYVASFAFHTLFALTITILARLYFSKIPLVDRLFWVNHITSTVHAVFTAGSCMYLLFVSRYYEETLLVDLPTQTFFSMVSSGYFLYDMLFITIWKLCGSRDTGGFPMVLHHFLAGGSFILAAHFRLSWCSSNWLATEASTPFVNVHLMLRKAKLDDHPLFLVNGVLMTVTFFLCRIIMILFFFWSGYVSMWDELWREQTPTVFTTCVLLAAITTALNLFWFQKMLRGAMKKLFAKKVQTKKD
eukprot:m.39224 g.39224  ORF g.39224 m.39224 type:complete len:289 (+) comp10289_c0_seq2:252-1118(+)